MGEENMMKTLQIEKQNGTFVKSYFYLALTAVKLQKMAGPLFSRQFTTR